MDNIKIRGNSNYHFSAEFDYFHIIIKKSIGCRLIATRDDQDAQSEIVTRKNCDYDLYGVQTHNYIITEINETDLFAELL